MTKIVKKKFVEMDGEEEGLYICELDAEDTNTIGQLIVGSIEDIYPINPGDRTMKTPFHDKSGNLHFPFRSLESKCFIWPCPPPETLGEEGMITIPQDWREDYQDGTGIVLSIGPGYYNKKNKWVPTDPGLKPGTKVYFDNTIPWSMLVLGADGKKHKIFVCVEADVLGVVEDED